MTPARYFSEALIALARPLAFICVAGIITLAARPSHIGLGSGPRVMHRIESVVSCTAIRCALYLSHQPHSPMSIHIIAV